MFNKTTIKELKELKELKGFYLRRTTRYQSWYNVLLDGWNMGFWFIITGIISIIASPFLAIHCYFYPDAYCVGNEERTEEDSLDNE